MTHDEETLPVTEVYSNHHEIGNSPVPPSFSKLSKHTFTQPQLVVLYCLKLKLGVTYRELSDWLAKMPMIQKVLGLKQLPHFTTVQKAFQRLSSAIWRLSAWSISKKQRSYFGETAQLQPGAGGEAGG